MHEYKLWYAYYNKDESFDDFLQFGGWKKPQMKQFEGNVELCGTLIDKDYWE